MNKIRSYLPVLFVLVILGFFIWALLPKEDFNKKISEQIKMEKEKADVIFKNATLAEISNGIKYWELIATDSSINNSKGIADLISVDGIFFENGRPTIKFIAPTAKWLMKGNEIYLNDPIGYDVRSEKAVRPLIEKAKKEGKGYSIFNLPLKRTSAFEGYWFEARNLNWKLATKKLLCVGAISLTKGNTSIRAEKLEADVGLENVILTGSPSAEIYSDDRAIIMNSNKMSVDSVSDTVIADGNVKISRGGSVITAGKTVYDQKNNLVSLTGDVYILNGQISAFAKRAEYDLKGDMVTLIDKAKAKRSGNEIYGDRMTIYLGRNKIVVQGKTKATVKQTEMK